MYNCWNIICDVIVGVTVGARGTAGPAALLIVLRPISTCIPQALNTTHGGAVAYLTDYLWKPPDATLEKLD